MELCVPAGYSNQKVSVADSFLQASTHWEGQRTEVPKEELGTLPSWGSADTESGGHRRMAGISRLQR